MQHEVQELNAQNEILKSVYDSDLDQKLTNVGLEKPWVHITTQLPVHKSIVWSPPHVTKETTKKYF